MKFFTRKRSLLLISILLIFSVCVFWFSQTEPLDQNSIQKELMALEVATGGRIGIAVINTANGQQIQYRANERFPIQSTVKVMVVAAILKRSMVDNNLMDQRVYYKKQNLDSWSPITEKNVAQGMTISELCAASIMYSDMTATKLLIKKLGGPKTITAYARSIGDTTFSMDTSDNSTPEAMAVSLQQIILGTVLGPPAREQLLTWMKGNTRGDKRIRASVTKGWTVADKTGSGDFGVAHDVANDIAIIYPPHCAPIIMSIFIENKKKGRLPEDIVATVTNILMNELAETDDCIRDTIYF